MWTQLAGPVGLALAGVGAFAVAGAAGSATPQDPQVWLEAPGSGATLRPGPVVITALGTADRPIAELELVVDGRSAGRTTDLERTGKLVAGRMTWTATTGAHTLVVRQVGGAGATSPVVVVTVVGSADRAGTDGTAPAASDGPEGPPASPDPSTSTTTTAAVRGEAVPTAPSSPTDHPGSPAPSNPAPTVPTLPPRPTVPPTTTVTPTTRAPATTVPPSTATTAAPVPRPTVDSAAFVGEPRVYAGSYCATYVVAVEARIRGADAAEVRLGDGSRVAMQRNASTWRATLGSGRYPVGSWRVEVWATNSSGSSSSPVGVLEVYPACPKD